MKGLSLLFERLRVACFDLFLRVNFCVITYLEVQVLLIVCVLFTFINLSISIDGLVLC